MSGEREAAQRTGKALMSLAAAPAAAGEVLHGLLVLHSRSGQLLFSQRLSPAFGLRSCEQLATDELRLGAMVFALHLNAADISGTPGAGLKEYRLDGVSVRFCEAAASELLLVLFAPATLGSVATEFFAAELLRRFEACFADILANPPVRALKRSAFAPSLRDAVAALHYWCLDRAIEEVGRLAKQLQLPAPSSAASPADASAAQPRLELRGLASLLSSGICEALSPSPAEASLATSTPVGQRSTASSGSNDAAEKKKLRPARRGVVPSAPSLPLLSILGLVDEPTKPPRRRKPGIFSCMPAHAVIQPKLAPPPPLPLLFWRDATTLSNAAKPDALSAAVTTARLHGIVKELHMAWRHRSLPSSGALYTTLATDAETKAPSFVLVLLRAPMVLHVRVSWRSGATLPREATVEAETLAAAVAALSAPLQPWLGPLALSLRYLGRVHARDHARDVARSSLIK